MTISEIMAEFGKYSTKRIIYTGGEPAMQKLRPLSDELHSKDTILQSKPMRQLN